MIDLSGLNVKRKNIPIVIVVSMIFGAVVYYYSKKGQTYMKRRKNYTRKTMQKDVKQKFRTGDLNVWRWSKCRKGETCDVKPKDWNKEGPDAPLDNVSFRGGPSHDLQKRRKKKEKKKKKKTKKKRKKKNKGGEE